MSALSPMRVVTVKEGVEARLVSFMLVEYLFPGVL